MNIIYIRLLELAKTTYIIHRAKYIQYLQIHILTKINKDSYITHYLKPINIYVIKHQRQIYVYQKDEKQNSERTSLLMNSSQLDTKWWISLSPKSNKGE